jgi:uncharacterized membrane protein YkoI
MRSQKTLLAVAAAAVFLAATALAQNAPLPPGSSADTNTAGTPWAGVTYTSLADAVRAVEQATGGKVLEVRFDEHSGHATFEAVVDRQNTLVDMRIDARTDEVTEINIKEIPQWMLDWKLRADMRSIEKAKVPLADAIRMAEQISGAPAIDAGLAKPLSADNAVLAYNIEVVKNGKPDRVVIDAVTGQVIADPDELLDPWTPEKLVHKKIGM